jgi:hypothetical protein
MVSSRHKLPVLVLDNADHFPVSFQERVYQYARSIYESDTCLVLLPITDRTSWQLSRHGALQSFEHESLHLPTPSLRAVLEKRIAYVGAMVESERQDPSQHYFLARGIRLELKALHKFVDYLQRLFLETQSVARWIGALANFDVRRALKLTRDVISSPHLRVDDLLKVYFTGDVLDVQQWRIKKAIICGRYQTHPRDQHEFVQNVYAMNEELPTTPLLGVRILQMLRDVPRHDHDESFVETAQVVDYFVAMGIEGRAVLLWLDSMLRSGFCQTYDPRADGLTEGARVRLAPCGHQHLMWGLRDEIYLQCMSEVCPILSPEDFDALDDAYQQTGLNGLRLQGQRFAAYLLSEDDRFCSAQSHIAYGGQNEVVRAVRSLADGRGRLAGQNSIGPHRPRDT